MELLNTREKKVVNECNKKYPEISQYILIIKQLKHWEDACNECYQHAMHMFIRLFTELQSDSFISVNDDHETLSSELKRMFSNFNMLAGNDQNLCDARDHLLLSLSAGQNVWKSDLDEISQEDIAFFVETAREMRELQEAYVLEVAKIQDIWRALELVSARVGLALNHFDLLETFTQD